LFSFGFSEVTQEAQLSPRDLRDALYQLHEILSYCCTNNINRSRVSLKCTFSNCHFLFGYLRNFVQASLQYAPTTSHTCNAESRACDPRQQTCWCQLDRICDEQLHGGNSSPIVTKLGQSYLWPQGTRWLNFGRSRSIKDDGGDMRSTEPFKLCFAYCI